MSDVHVRRAFIKILKKLPEVHTIKEELRCTELKLEKIKEVLKWG
jgi:CRISPR/Cas system endoribonuclease Cas6 (RAMP superfamily)